MATPLESLPPRLRDIGYVPPVEPADCILDIVTPTCDRRLALLKQAAKLGPQLSPLDRWLIVDDASSAGAIDPRELLPFLPEVRQLLFVALTYSKAGLPYGSTLQRARHAACSLARPDAWIVEVDDHDYVTPECLAMVRATICRGATFIYGDCLHTNDNGDPVLVYHKPDYRQWLLRDELSPCEGIRCYPKFLYEAVGGFRWYGENDVGGNEWPAGDYGLFLRIEQFCEGHGFTRIPALLCSTVKSPEGISGKYSNEQQTMAALLRAAAHAGAL
jgi:hypothetical protein